MSTRRFAIALLLLVIPTPAMADDNTDAKWIGEARQALQWLREGKSEQFVEACNDTMKNAIPAKQLEGLWTQLESNFGAYEGEISATCSKIEKYQTVTLVSRFANSALDVRISFDVSGKIAGLFFTPSSQDVAYTAPDYADEKKFTERPVKVTCGAFSLDGTLTLPVAEGPHRAVVLVHGSGPHDQDETIFLNKPFRDLAWGLATKGVAVLRYEKRTRKYGPQMDPTTVDIDSETADDAIAAAQLLMARPDIQADHVYIVGHSLGASAAPYIASKERRIAGIVLLGAAARPIYELVADQIPYLARIDGTVTPDEQKSIDETLAMVSKLRSGKIEPGDTLLGAPAQYWKALDRMDAVGFARKCTKPMLILQGGRDYQVTDKEFEIWREQLRDHKNVTLRRYEKLDHLFHAGEGKSGPDDYRRKGYVDPVVIADIAAWVKRQD